jgi:hypothetical protein
MSVYVCYIIYFYYSVSIIFIYYILNCSEDMLDLWNVIYVLLGNSGIGKQTY